MRRGYIKKLPKSIVDDLSGFSEEAFGRIIKDLGDDPKLLEELLKNPKLVEAWKKLDEMIIDEALRKNPDVLKSVDDAAKEGLDGLDAIEDAIQMSQKTKPTWDKIKALFKRGDDFNEKARDNF